MPPDTPPGEHIQLSAAELPDFLDCVGTRRRPSAEAVGSGVVLARVMESLYASASSGAPVDMSWSPAETAALAEAPVTVAP